VGQAGAASKPSSPRELVISLVTSVMFGVLPARRASRERFDGALKESARPAGSRGYQTVRTCRYF